MNTTAKPAGLPRRLLSELRLKVFGPPRSPLDPKSREKIALVAFLAWIGLGADGLSSANYGPEEAFLALGGHHDLAIYLAAVTAITVMVIAFAYNQVIELFPGGGGGYKVATSLLGAEAGLVSGAALVVDYVLTIAISIAAGVDAVLSLMPLEWQAYKIPIEVGLILLLLVFNLRGMRESILVLMPIFLGFLVTHVLLIVIGIGGKLSGVPGLLPETVHNTRSLAAQIGWVALLSLLLKAYSLGGGTYTGIEAVSNNIHVLAEPRVKTGKLTMLMIAVSLSFTAAGIILLYLLWHAEPVAGQTLNAVVFRMIMAGWQIGGVQLGGPFLLAVLIFEAGLLFVAANTGFLGGPAVLANMAVDDWLPRRFAVLSSRLVTQYGISLMAAAAILLVIWTHGSLDLLVVLYSINVFLTFTLSLLGLCVHWIRHRRQHRDWWRRLALSGVGAVVTGSILVGTLVEKFTEGAWITAVVTGALIALCFVIRRHYRSISAHLLKADALFASQPAKPVENPPPLDPTQRTAVFLVSDHVSVGMHTVLWVKRLFPNVFKNYVFISVGQIDHHSYGSEEDLAKVRRQVEEGLAHFVNYCHRRGVAATGFLALGTDRVAELMRLIDRVHEQFPDSLFFATKLIWHEENWIMGLLHNQVATAVQRRLHLQGGQMMILPMKVD